MDFPEINHSTALSSKPWQVDDPVSNSAMYIDHLMPYEQFFQDIFLKNQLCIVGPCATSNWASTKDWVLEDGTPNFTFLVENYGKTSASVADCNEQEFSAHPKAEMTVENYILYWQKQRTKEAVDGKCLYLKDWHFHRQFPLYRAYNPPAFLCSDWMNEFWDARQDLASKDDYRFVYMGPRNSWTPFHADVLHSYSWSANICGQKKWIIFPPGCERNLQNRCKQMVFDIRSEEISDPKIFPQALQAMGEAITVFQNPGEIIFIPSGWYHQVINLEDTISINHNWINGCNSHLVWAYIKGRLLAVQEEISDCKDMTGWNEHCQVILKADSGINYMDFYNFLATIANHRVRALHQYAVDLLLPKFVQKMYIRESIASILPALPSHPKHFVPAGKSLVCMLEDPLESISSLPSPNVISCDVVVSLPKSSSTCNDDVVVGQEPSALLELNFVHYVRCNVALENPVLVFVDHNFNQEFSSFEGGSFEDSFDKQENKGTPPPGTSSCNEPQLMTDKPALLKPGSVMGPSNFDHQSEGIYTKCSPKSPVCLCLISGTTVHSRPETFSGDISVGTSTQSPAFPCDHRHCPHWAHCGPNLALFDIQRVLDLVKDMAEQPEFLELLNDPSSMNGLVLPPLELIHSIENIIHHVALI